MVLMWWGNNMSIWADFQTFLSGGKQQVKQPVVEQPTEAVKPDYLERLKMAESGGKADVTAKTSSATGHHQFIDSTWKSLTTKYDKPYTLEDRKDPIKSLEIAKLYTNENKAILQKALNSEPTDTQLYAAHFLGTTGAKKFLLASPKKLAKDVVNKSQVAANKTIFFDKEGKPRTVSQVYGVLQKKIGEE
jgi:hypothetical protein